MTYVGNDVDDEVDAGNKDAEDDAGPSTSAAAAAQQCPYFSFTSLEDVVQTARESDFVGGGSSNVNNRAAASAASNVVSVGVDLSSLSRYESHDKT